MNRITKAGLITVAIVAGGFWLAWGNPGRESVSAEWRQRDAVRAAIEHYAAIHAELPVGVEIRRAGASILAGVESLRAVDLSGAPEGFREAWSGYADALADQGLYAVSVDLSRPGEELDAREAVLKAATAEAEHGLFNEARRSGLNVRAVTSPD